MILAFVSSSPSSVVFGPSFNTRSTCPARRRTPVVAITQPPQSPQGGNNQWSNDNWGNDAQVYDSATEETLEFVIRPGGIVEETVTGVKGGACEKITEKIEQALGTVLSTTKTSEYFEVSEKVTEKVDISVSDDSDTPQNRTSWTNW